MPRFVVDVPATSHFNFLSGSFALNSYAIPYFVTTISFADAARDLHLTNEVPGGESIAWKLDELYQRDIDWVRVQRRIVPYLRNASTPQFFNSITIALLPFDAHAGSIVQRFSGDGEWTAPDLDRSERFGKIQKIGPLTMGFWDEWNKFSDRGFESGQMRWNTDQVFGVAIDGQHRLASIKELADSVSGPTLHNAQVPVIFLVFDEALGFKAPTQAPVVDLLRQLFIDLNKHAQGVSRARQILLDDRDPHAVAVRSILQPELSDSLNALHSLPPQLPLSLVDWHSEQAKFDQGPYLTTVLGLDWIVGEVLQTKPIGDWTDYRAVTRQILKLRDRLGIDVTDALRRVEDLQNVKQSPFTYTDDDLEMIGNTFAGVWGPSIIKILTGFSPYAELLNRRVHDGSTSLEFQHWFRLYQAHLADRQFDGRATQEYRRFLGRMIDTDNPRSETDFKSTASALDGLKLDSLAFNVVFQRALIGAFLEYAKLEDSAIDELSEWAENAEVDELSDEDFLDDEVAYEGEPGDVQEVIEASGSDGLTSRHPLRDKNERRSSEFMSSLNRVIETWPEVLEIDCFFTNSLDRPTYLWQGTLRKADGGIDFTQGASTRAHDLIFMVAAMCLYDDLTGPEESSDFDEFWEECISGEGPILCKAVGRAIRRFSDKETTTAAGKILKAADRPFDREEARGELRERLAAVWQFLDL